MAIGRLIFTGMLLVFLLLILGGSWYTVPEGYRGVIVRNGAFIGVAEPGLGFKMPLFDSVYDVSVQTQKITFESMPTYSKDIQQSENSVAINYRLLPSHVQQMYAEYGLDYAERILWNRISERFKETYGQYSAADIINKREQVSAAITDRITADMAPYGIVIEDVQIINIDFSSNYEKAVEAAAQAEADVKRARQELERARVEAQQRVAVAEAEAQSVVLAADAESYRIRQIGDAEALAIEARGRALQANQRLVELIAVERWNGILPVTMLPDSTVPFIPVPAGTTVR